MRNRNKMYLVPPPPTHKLWSPVRKKLFSRFHQFIRAKNFSPRMHFPTEIDDLLRFPSRQKWNNLKKKKIESSEAFLKNLSQIFFQILKIGVKFSLGRKRLFTFKVFVLFFFGEIVFLSSNLYFTSFFLSEVKKKRKKEKRSA